MFKCVKHRGTSRTCLDCIKADDQRRRDKRTSLKLDDPRRKVISLLNAQIELRERELAQEIEQINGMKARLAQVRRIPNGTWTDVSKVTLQKDKYYICRRRFYGGKRGLPVLAQWTVNGWNYPTRYVIEDSTGRVTIEILA